MSDLYLKAQVRLTNNLKTLCFLLQMEWKLNILLPIACILKKVINWPLQIKHCIIKMQLLVTRDDVFLKANPEVSIAWFPP